VISENYRNVNRHDRKTQFVFVSFIMHTTGIMKFHLQLYTIAALYGNDIFAFGELEGVSFLALSTSHR